MDAPALNELFRKLGRDAVGWMRFHAEGQVLLASVTPACAHLVACWLRHSSRVPAHLPQGTWTLGDSLQIHLAAKLGFETFIDYEGQTEDGGARLELKGQSRTTGPHARTVSLDETWTLVPLPDEVLATAHSTKQYRTIRSITKLAQALALGAAERGVLKKTRGLTLTTLNVLELEELVQLGVPTSLAARVVAYRLGQ